MAELIVEATKRHEVDANSSDSDESFTDEDLETYLRSVEHSDGFDVVVPPKLCVMGGIYPVYSDEFKSRKGDFEELANFGLKEYNKKNENKKLELVKVIKLNAGLVAGVIYYLTLLVKDTEADNDASDQNLICWAKVWEHIGEGEKELLSFKILTEEEVKSFNILT